MALYAIKDTTLTNIADALRRHHGETKPGIGTLYHPWVEVAATSGASSFYEYPTEAFKRGGQNWLITIPNAVKIKVRFVVFTKITDCYIAVGDHLDLSGNYCSPDFQAIAQKFSSTPTPFEIQEAIFEDTDTITVGCKLSSYYGNFDGLYLEATGIDAEGNEIRKPICEISKSAGATGPIYTNNYGGVMPGDYEPGIYLDNYTTITIPGANKMVVDLSYQYSYYSGTSQYWHLYFAPGAYTTAEDFPIDEAIELSRAIVGEFDGPAKRTLTIEGTDTITIRHFQDIPTEYQNSACFKYYAEIIGFDAEGKSIDAPGYEGEVQVPNTYLPGDMADAINDITPYVESTEITITKNGTYEAPAGGYGPVIVDIGGLPDEAFKVSGNCQNKFANGGWDWFIDMFGDQITTSDITTCNNMFNNAASVVKIPFDINVTSNCTVFTNMFSGMGKLEVAPNVYGDLPGPTGAYSGTLDLGGMFQSCSRLRTIPYDFYNNFISESCAERSALYSSSRNGQFWFCYSLRQLPDLSRLKCAWNASYGTLYYTFIEQCYALDEALNIPAAGTFSSNAFGSYFAKQTNRIKNLTFATNEDGTPVVANWKSQTIDISDRVGWADTIRNITSYNSGIAADKEVKDDATYQALKDDPDWFTLKVAYSRYNHDSAVNTINSLPDTVAYGGGNTIKFKGAAGELTDGGAINTLTEEEIAVAAAKGWTISFV